MMKSFEMFWHELSLISYGMLVMEDAKLWDMLSYRKLSMTVPWSWKEKVPSSIDDGKAVMIFLHHGKRIMASISELRVSFSLKNSQSEHLGEMLIAKLSMSQTLGRSHKYL